MKSFFLKTLLVALALTAAYEARGQDPGAFEEWAPVGARWYYGCDSAFILESKKNVVFQGKPSRLIESNKHTSMSYCFSGGNADVLHLYTYKEGDKVYLWYPNHNQWGLFYDFAAQKGDTLTLLSPYFGCGLGGVAVDSIFRVTVDSVYTKVIAGKTLKAQYFAPIFDGASSIFFEGEVLENIGNVLRFIPIFGTDESIDYYTILMRYESPKEQYIPEFIYGLEFGVTYQMSIREEYCPQFVTNRAPFQKEKKARLGYDPVAQKLNLVFPQNYTEKFQTYEIIDGTGRTIIEAPIIFPGSVSNIDVQALPAGVYFLRVQNPSTQLSFKFFKF